ncbi:MAG: molybdopterin-guanine dinucleotide biosynthesis protein B [Epsilonproteobacteria bacterium]|nr:molybdopterin-guanine dinucleotide biosynthesis protein B [Campylobacterota bacterium]NPA57248.1 molybdopterin-guanine dinucleotide biosynthesis protein B [Campylobacterota bacterium]
MAKGVAFTGPSNSGKTTLIEKVARLLIPRYRVAIVKNDPKDKAQFDREGKDSWRFFQTGAEVAVTSPRRTTYFSHRSRELWEVVELMRPFDLLLVEGLKEIPLPRIGVFRERVDTDYLPYIRAVAIDGSVERGEIPEGIEILDLNNPHMVVEWILKNGEEV